MEKEQENILLEKVKSEVSMSIDAKMKAFKETDAEYLALKSLKEGMKDLTTNAEFTKLKEDCAKLSLDLQAMKEKPVKGVRKSFAQSVTESLNEMFAGKDGGASIAEQMKKNRNTSFNFEVKAATTMTTGNVTPVGTGGISGILTDIEAGLTPIPRSQPFLADLMNTGTTTGSEVSYAEIKNPDGGAGMTGEGSAKTQADFDIVEAKSSVKKITSYIKTSKEALSDIGQLQAEINNELVTLIKLKKDNQLLEGDGTGNNLDGIINRATAFDGGGMTGANALANPNNFDVLAAATNQVKIAEVISGVPAGFMPNYIVVHPTDFMAMKLTKDANEQYLFPVVLPGLSQVINVPVIENANMNEGQFLVGDFTKANVRIREDIGISIGYENDDFTKNLITILAEMRLAFYVKSNHTKAFVYGTYAAAKLLLV